MRFVKYEDLKPGMRIARPIYNKKGVLLYDRGSKLTDSAVSSVKNFGLIGVYILDAAEPIPPMTEEDIEFERFQAINVFALGDEVKAILNTKHTRKLDIIAADIQKNYGHLRKKINFTQGIRSQEDFVYKHCLNVALLSAMMCNKMNAPAGDINDCLLACLIHDIGKTTVPFQLLFGEEPDEIERILDTAQETGFEIVAEVFSSNQNVRRICAQTHKILQDLKYGREQEKMKIFLGTRVMLVAEVFDDLTSMDISGNKEPLSPIKALSYLLEHPDVFNKKAVEALTESIEILGPGTSVELSNGDKALVVSSSTADLLHPMVLNFHTNEMIDLSNRRLYDDLEIVDVVKTMDSRYVMSDEDLRKLGIKK